MTDTQIKADLIIVNGTLVDGSDAPRRRADIAICEGRVVAVVEPGRLTADGADTIDASDRIVAPGFIDVHTHDDGAILVGPEMTPKLSQGVTTVVAGNCGISIAPIRLDDAPPPLNLLGNPGLFRFASVRDYAEAVDAAQPSINLCYLVGHGTLRMSVMDDLRRKATAREIDLMRAHLAEGLEVGAIGLSSGLYYKTSQAADMDEMVALAELLAGEGGIYTTHMRDEHEGVLDSLDETFETARRANVPVVVSHHKCAGRKNWGRSRETLPKFDAAIQRQPVGLDAYPYAAGSTVLEPDWVDPSIRILVTWSRSHPGAAGRDLADIAEEWNCSVRDAAERLKPAGAIYFQMAEEDVRRILAYPATMIGSDGLPNDDRPHPRLWGTFPRVLGHYCRDEGLFPLERAVHKMTGLSARTFGLVDRGIVREGAHADIVVFDADAIADRATFEEPKQPSAGIDHVIVNGRVAWSQGVARGPGHGRFLRRQG